MPKKKDETTYYADITYTMDIFGNYHISVYPEVWEDFKQVLEKGLKAHHGKQRQVRFFLYDAAGVSDLNEIKKGSSTGKVE